MIDRNEPSAWAEAVFCDGAFTRLFLTLSPSPLSEGRLSQLGAIAVGTLVVALDILLKPDEICLAGPSPFIAQTFADWGFGQLEQLISPRVAGLLLKASAPLTRVTRTIMKGSDFRSSDRYADLSKPLHYLEARKARISEMIAKQVCAQSKPERRARGIVARLFSPWQKS